MWFDLPAQRVNELAQNKAPSIWVASMSEPVMGSWAQVRHIDPQLDAGTPVQRVRPAVEQLPAGIHLGSLVGVELAPAPSSAELYVPVSAVWAHAGQQYVWRIDKQSSQVQAAEVEVLERDDTRASVRSALQPGDRVVSAGVARLREGQRVRLGECGG